MSRYKVYLRPSVADMLAHAKTESDVQAFLLEACSKLEPSAATKRKWVAMAEARIGLLRTSSLLDPSGQRVGV
ncbi:MAG TPA: hypothetical protein VFP48_01645 [Steroidobacteraceae bacterium]|nr:hypothetical protein [Steroidobacteraceae bacterium]